MLISIHVSVQQIECRATCSTPIDMASNALGINPALMSSYAVADFYRRACWASSADDGGRGNSYSAVSGERRQI